MSDDDRPEYGYEPAVDREADPHDPSLGGDETERSWRRLGYELTSARDVESLVATFRRYGWAPPFLALLVHGGVRGVFEHLAEPFAMSHGYVFAGWQLALAINLFFGLFLVLFSWFLYFGVIGVFAGTFSSETKMETTTFKAGAYLLVVFVPLLVVASLLVLTIPAPDVVGPTVGDADAVAEPYQAIDETAQMQVIDTLLSAGWILVGFLMVPIVGELYDIDAKASVLSVLPVTLIAVVGTQLV